MTDKIAALLHVWESDYTELGAYEAMTPDPMDAREIRAKRDQLKACMEQLRTAVAKPLPPDIRKHIVEWLASAENPVPEKQAEKVFFIGQPHQLARFISREKLHPSQVVHIRDHQAVRGWSADTHGNMSVHVSGETPWPLAETLLQQLKERGFTRTYSPAR
jgi:hypothetical protein